MGPLYESQISERCQWEALNAVITAATQSPLMGSGWDCTWNCVCMYASLIACVCVNVNILCVCLQMEDHCGCGLDDKKQSSCKKKSYIPLCLFGLQDKLIFTHACTRCLTCLDFQTSSTGIPAMIELGSSWAAEFTVSLAPITRVRSVSDRTHNKVTLENI